MIEPVGPGVGRIALRTPTLPPATHTNTWILGHDALTVVDPASPWPDEQARLIAALRARARDGVRVERLFLTHHHDDHVGGVDALADALAEDGPRPVIAAHRITAERVPFAVDVEVAPGPCDWGGITWHALFTPGHAPGHLVLHDRASGQMIAGDMVAGVGTILIDPADGDLGQYLASLELMRRAGPTALMPAHGPVLTNADALLSMYIAHRHARTEQVRAALDRAGAADPAEIAAIVYPELPPAGQRIAAIQVRSILAYLRGHGLAHPVGGGQWAADA